MLFALVLTLVSAAFLVALILIAVGLYKDPILHHFERYAEADDNFFLLPLILVASGLFAIFVGVLFTATLAPRFPAFLIGGILLLAAYLSRENRRYMSMYPQIFLSFPRWYAELRERTTREERRRIAYMWLCLPRSMRMHLNGSDRHFLIWADQVILATVTQTVEDQEAKSERSYEYYRADSTSTHPYHM
jgi:hypothetical protein